MDPEVLAAAGTAAEIPGWQVHQDAFVLWQENL